MNRRKRRGGNVFEFYSGGGGGDSDKPIDRTIYRAFGLENTGAYKGQEEWLYIEFNPRGEAHMLRYDKLQRIYSPGHDVVALIFPDESFTLVGRFVDQIMLPIQDRRLRSIYLFDAGFHQEPPEDEAKITTIDLYTKEQWEQNNQQA